MQNRTEQRGPGDSFASCPHASPEAWDHGGCMGCDARALLFGLWLGGRVRVGARTESSQCRGGRLFVRTKWMKGMHQTLEHAELPFFS